MTKCHTHTRLIGLTGNIASGKSAVLTYLAQCGAQTLSCDALVRELYQKPCVRQQLQKWFSSAQPAEVAQQVFASASARRKLERFLHPLVWERVQQSLASCSKGWLVLEVPLLFETDWYTRMDLTVLVAGSQRTLAKRLRARGLSKESYQSRLKAQMPQEDKIKLADIVLFNDSSKQALAAKTKRLYQALETFYA